MALLLGMAMLPAGAIAMQVGLNAVSMRQAAYEEALGRRALQSIDLERGIIDQVRELVRVMAASPAIRQSAGCQTWLNGIRDEYSDVAAMAVTSLDGRILCSAPEARENSRPQPSALRRLALARDELVMGYVEHGRLVNAPVLAAMAPIRDANGRRTGFIGLSIKIDVLRQALDRSRDVDGARTAIVDNGGRVIAQSAIEPGRTPPDLPSAEQVRSHLGPNPRFVDVPNGSAVVAPLSAPDLYIVMSWPPDQPEWRRWFSYFVSVAAPLLIWALAVAAGWFAIEIYVARPLSALENAARSAARGEDVHEPPSLIDAPVEIRSLRRTLAAMAKTLRGREARLIEALSEERALLREVHHRVKNNLQMVASLLSIQSRASKDESEAWGLARAHDRVQLLAQVHQRIYASGAVREVRLDELAADIARQLLLARGAQAQNIQLKLDLGPARANADRAVPLAFLIGEGVSSALDALAGEAAELCVGLRQDEDGATRIVIDATTNGRPSHAAIGARLIEAFTRQLGAQLGRLPDKPLALWISVPPSDG